MNIKRFWFKKKNVSFSILPDEIKFQIFSYYEDTLDKEMQIFFRTGYFLPNLYKKTPLEYFQFLIKKKEEQIEKWKYYIEYPIYKWNENDILYYINIIKIPINYINSNKENILHICFKKNYKNVLFYLLKNENCSKLILQEDKGGLSPWDLALNDQDETYSSQYINLMLKQRKNMDDTYFKLPLSLYFLFFICFIYFFFL